MKQVALARSSTPEVRNPLLKLASAAQLAGLDEQDRLALRSMLDSLRRQARGVSDELWSRGRRRQAAYWRASSVYAYHAARLANTRATPRPPAADPHVLDLGRAPNPLLRLPAVRAVRALSPAARHALELLLLDLRGEALAAASKSWATAKSPLASYWSDVATFAGHCARHVRRAHHIGTQTIG